MKILEVTFDCTIAMPGYSNVKPGIGRAIIDESNGETPEQAWSELNRRAQEWHKKEYPHLYEPIDPGVFTYKGLQISDAPHLTRRDTPVPIISKDKERLEIIIDNALEIRELYEVKDQCVNFGLSDLWMNKFNELNR